MSSLYRRANGAQRQMLRIIEGAVKNATDAHPGLEIPPHHRRSIAKRAAGTLTAQWPDVLARASLPVSDSGASVTLITQRRQSSELTKAIVRGALRVQKRPPFRQLISAISRPIRDLKLSGQHERAQAMIDVLRLIDRLQREAIEGVK